MIPLCWINGDITHTHLVWKDRIKSLIGNIVEPEPGKTTCHDVCAQIVKKWPETFLHYRGKFHNWDHSWLMFRDDPYTILDPYPWACGSGPLLVTTNGMTPWRFLYVGEPCPES
jgi:hypothetical protein